MGGPRGELDSEMKYVYHYRLGILYYILGLFSNSGQPDGEGLQHSHFPLKSVGLGSDSVGCNEASLSTRA